MRLFDSHAHLTDSRFDLDREEALDRAREAGVVALVSIASDLEDAAAAQQLAVRSASPRVYSTAGVHPHAADSFDDAAGERLQRMLAAGDVVAVGETGLDFYYENAPRAKQLAAFRAQLALAERHDLPVVVHSREAESETVAMLREFSGRVTGVLHCFSSGAELLEAGLAADWYVSFSGIVSFKSYGDGELIRRVPAKRILVETDSPYLAPVPRRGRRNEPAYVVHVVERVAEARGIPVGELAELTYRNACRFYRVDP